MKKILIAVSIIFMSNTVFTQAGPQTGFYSGGHDSLLFDGENKTISANDNEECIVEVIGVVGNVEGSRLVYKDMRACGEGSILEKQYEKGLVKNGDKLLAGEPISSSEGTVFLKLNDGRVFMLGHNSSMTISKEYCKKNTIRIDFHYGYGAVDGKGDKSNNMNITTERGRVDITGTKFSLQTVSEGNATTDILRVYEGSVTFQKNMQNESNITKAEDKGAEIKKLTEDFQAGKIGIEEYTKKMQGLTGKVTETLKPVTVTAGFESRIVNTEIPTEPAPFDAIQYPWGEGK